MTTLTGTTLVDTANIVTLNNKVVIAANTGNDIVTANPGTGNQNLDDWNVNMGGGDDTFTLGAGENLLNSFVQLDGATATADGADTLNATTASIISSEVRGLGGIDTINLGAMTSATINGNAGNDAIATTAGTNAGQSEILGGQGVDTITVNGTMTNTSVNGNKGIDTIILAAVAHAGSTIYGGQGADLITSASTSDGVTLSGDKGADTIVDGAADTTILGGDDNDTMTGGAGADTLTGGGGVNSFNNSTLTDSSISGNAGFDEITDFVTTGTSADVIRSGDAETAILANRTVAAGATTLGATLQATILAATGTFTEAGDVETVNITAPVAFAGTYIVIGATNATIYVNTTDAVIKVNTVAGLSAANFSA